MATYDCLGSQILCWNRSVNIRVGYTAVMRMAKSKNSKSTSVVSSSRSDAQNAVLDVLASLITSKGALVSAIDWSALLMDNAESYSSFDGTELLNRTLKIRKAAKDGEKPPVFDMHLTIYANKVRDDLIASGKVQRRFVPTIVNITKMAVAYLLKEPISIEMALAFAETYVAADATRLLNTLASYLQQIRPTNLTQEIFNEKDFYGALYDAYIHAWHELLTQHWQTLAPRNVDAKDDLDT